MQTHPVTLQPTHYNTRNTVWYPRPILVSWGMQAKERNNGLLHSYQCAAFTYKVLAELISLCVCEYVLNIFMMT